MADTQSQLPTNSAATEFPRTRFLRSLISVFKDNRDVFPDLPDIIECLIANEGDMLNKLNTAHVSSEENRTSTEKGSMPEDNVEAAKKETRFMEEKVKERIQFLEAELEEKRKEVSEKEKKMSTLEKDIEAKLAKEKTVEFQNLYDKYSTSYGKLKTKTQLLEAELEEKRKEVLEKEKKMSKMEKDIEAKLAKEKTVEFQNLYDKYSTSYGKLKTKNDALKKDLQEKDETILHHSQRTQLLEAELEEKRKEVLEKEKKMSKMEKDIEAKIQLLEAELEGKRNEVLEKENKMLKMEKDIEEKTQLLEAELEEKRKEVIEKDKKMSKMEKDIEEKLAKEKELEIQNLRDGYSTSYRKLKAESEQRKEVILNMEQQHFQRLSKVTDELKDAYSKMDDYKSRLASLSEKRVKQDQRLVEDTLSLNRQSGLERDFSDFFDGERMDACDKMQTIYQNKEEDFLYIFYPRLACIILESAYEKVKEVNEAAIDLFTELTENMVKNAAQMGQLFCITRKLSIERKYHHDECTVPITVALWREASNYPKDTIDGLTLALKETADICNLDFLIYEVAHLAFDKWNKWIEEDKTCLFTPSWHLLESLVSYINASIRLAWRMVTQVPPMKLEYKIMKYDKRIHKKISRNRNLKDRPRNRFSAQQDQDEEIACYLWPGLQDGGGRQTRLGEVLCFV